MPLGLSWEECWPAAPHQPRHERCLQWPAQSDSNVPAFLTQQKGPAFKDPDSRLVPAFYKEVNMTNKVRLKIGKILALRKADWENSWMRNGQYQIASYQIRWRRENVFPGFLEALVLLNNSIFAQGVTVQTIGQASLNMAITRFGNHRVRPHTT